MTKFIEGAREIEMDAVAKDGKVCTACQLFHIVREHWQSFSLHFEVNSASMLANCFCDVHRRRVVFANTSLETLVCHVMAPLLL